MSGINRLPSSHNEPIQSTTATTRSSASTPTRQGSLGVTGMVSAGLDPGAHRDAAAGRTRLSDGLNDNSGPVAPVWIPFQSMLERYHVPPEQQTKISSSAARFNAAAENFLRSGGSATGTDIPEEMRLIVGELDSTTSEATGETEIGARITNTIMAGTSTITDQIRELSATMEGRNQLKQRIRASRILLGEALASWPEGQTTSAQLTWVELDSNGNPVTKSGTFTKAELNEKLTKLDGDIASITDLTQLEQTKLQDLYQKYQMMFTLLSNILKAEFDTAKGIIGNIR